MNDKDLQFFQPVWRRVVVVVALAGWTAVEWWTGNSFWGTLTSGALVYCAWMCKVHYPRKAVAPRNE